MATRTISGKKLLDLIRQEHRKLLKLRARDAILNNRIQEQSKKIDRLLDKMSKEDLDLYHDQLGNILTEL